MHITGNRSRQGAARSLQAILTAGRRLDRDWRVERSAESVEAFNPGVEARC